MAAAAAVSPSAPESLVMNPGQPWTLTALASYLSVLTGGHCVDGKHTQACTWGLPRILLCGGWSWPEAPIRLLEDSRGHRACDPWSHPQGIHAGANMALSPEHAEPTEDHFPPVCILSTPEFVLISVLFKQ